MSCVLIGTSKTANEHHLHLALTALLLARLWTFTHSLTGATTDVATKLLSDNLVKERTLLKPYKPLLPTLATNAGPALCRPETNFQQQRQLGSEYQTAQPN